MNKNQDFGLLDYSFEEEVLGKPKILHFPIIVKRQTVVTNVIALPISLFPLPAPYLQKLQSFLNQLGIKR